MTQGDPRLILGPDGAYLQFVGGQPLMDAGLENLALISLFTAPGWCGNTFMNLNSQIGSDFEAACDQPITRAALNQIRNAAERALKHSAFGQVDVTVTNPDGYRLSIQIRITPPGSNPQEILLQKNGGNWKYQAHDPAYRRIRETPWRKALVFEDGNPLQFEDGTTLEF